jgi:NAD+ kinase
MLAFDLIRSGRSVASGQVANDLVVGRGGMARLIDFRLRVEAKELGRVRADGVIVATPIGSTAYAVAAGGALLSPELDVMQVCPICPFQSKMRPVVLPSRLELDIELEAETPEGYLTIDGQWGCGLKPGDLVQVREAASRLWFLETQPGAYVEKLQAKGYL